VGVSFEVAEIVVVVRVGVGATKDIVGIVVMSTVAEVGFSVNTDIAGVQSRSMTFRHA